MSDLILRNDTEASVTRLVLNSDRNLNALSDGMLAELSVQLDEIAADTTVKAVILAGAGRVFCAGHDLKEMTAKRTAVDGGKAGFIDLFQRCSAVMQQITTLPQPVIAEVHNIATAAGCQLVATCDLAIAAEGTRFGVNGVNIGLFCSTPMVALTRNIPRKQAFELLTTGEFLDADQAVSLGLINRVVPAEDLQNATMELAEKIAGKLPSAVKIGKEAFYKQLEMPLSEAYDYTGQVITENMMLRDTEAMIETFINRKK
ncbi:enoyl-CoA hydratase [Halocynthiibacter styelae]|uniref:Enoyl-CoA hydratase domain-containing protein 3, mitochondrial n=1 Tax=Halocynthiibacter styelae TaxID=2761955 RepID=A0A8J7IVF9_9RHOB|nr:enoyl-CoA hydratase [Paenihalocynthiibacter styelae]MBI1492280.1 enoyl-CoA hydratase [Paenihalocynthiibacter styelae]